MNTETTDTSAETAPAVPEAPAPAPETMQADELLQHIEAAVERGIKKALAAKKPDPLETAWLRSYGKHFRGVPGGSLNVVEVEALQSFGKQAGNDAAALIEVCLANWEECASIIKRDTNSLLRPSVSVYALADNVKVIKAWVKLRGLITGVPVVREPLRIGTALPATEYVSHTRKGIA